MLRLKIIRALSVTYKINESIKKFYGRSALHFYEKI